MAGLSRKEILSGGYIPQQRHGISSGDVASTGRMGFGLSIRGGGYRWVDDVEGVDCVDNVDGVDGKERHVRARA
jgi:hypothetical protein